MRIFAIVLAGVMAFGVAKVAAADAVPANWIEVAAGPMFTVKAPPGTTSNASAPAMPSRARFMGRASICQWSSAITATP